MSGAREAVLGKLRRRLKSETRDAAALASLEARLDRPSRNLVPQRGQVPAAARVDLFESMAVEQAATLERLTDAREVPAAVARYLAAQNLPARVKRSPDPALEALPWSDQPLLQCDSGRSDGDDLVSLTPAFAAVAETGTLIMMSGPHGPTTLNFLPDYHIVVLRASDLVGAYEEIWPRLRARYGQGVMPRTVNCITGPSRTADIEQTIQLGAHGPRRLHILLLEDTAPSNAAPPGGSEAAQ